MVFERHHDLRQSRLTEASLIQKEFDGLHRMLLDERAVLRIERIGSHQNVGRTIAQADVVKYGAHADVCQLHF